MSHTITRLFSVAVVVTALTLSAGESSSCSAPARECEEQIPRMISGRRYLGVTVELREEGLVVKTVQPNSPAHRAGMARGDRLIAINGHSLTEATPREFKQVIAGARETGRLFIIISRGGAHRKLGARLEPYSKEQVAKIVAAHLSQSHAETTTGAH